MKIGIDYIGVSAGTVIVDKNGKYFLAKRGPAARDDQDCWEFPGGSVDFYETREDAARRNIREKYNIEINITRLLGVYDVIDKSNKDHWLSTTYLCTYIRGEPKIANISKCTEVAWFTLDEIRSLTVSRITKFNLTDLLKKQ